MLLNVRVSRQLFFSLTNVFDSLAGTGKGTAKKKRHIQRRFPSTTEIGWVSRWRKDSLYSVILRSQKKKKTKRMSTTFRLTLVAAEFEVPRYIKILSDYGFHFLLFLLRSYGTLSLLLGGSVIL